MECTDCGKYVDYAQAEEAEWEFDMTNGKPFCKECADKYWELELRILYFVSFADSKLNCIVLIACKYYQGVILMEFRLTKWYSLRVRCKKIYKNGVKVYEVDQVLTEE